RVDGEVPVDARGRRVVRDHGELGHAGKEVLCGGKTRVRGIQCVALWVCPSSERCRNQTFPCLPEVAANEQDVERNITGSKKIIDAMTLDVSSTNTDNATRTHHLTRWVLAIPTAAAKQNNLQN
ncbi:unnamed protein product, partial [Ectocarpus sp. 8 AP-2014]